MAIRGTLVAIHGGQWGEWIVTGGGNRAKTRPDLQLIIRLVIIAIINIMRACSMFTVVFNVTFILYYNNSYFIITQASKRLCNNNNIKYLATNHLRKSSISCQKLQHFERRREMTCRRSRPPCKENTFPVTKAAPRGHLHEERVKKFDGEKLCKIGALWWEEQIC